MSQDQSVNDQSELQNVNGQLDQIHGELIGFKYKEENGRAKSHVEMQANLERIRASYLAIDRSNLSGPELYLANNIEILFAFINDRIDSCKVIEEQRDFIINNLYTSYQRISLRDDDIIEEIQEICQILLQLDILVTEVNDLLRLGNTLTRGQETRLNEIRDNMATTGRNAGRLLINWLDRMSRY